MNETTPKISVIVPVYKAEEYLHRCVDSILAQTFQDFEVLLIDDGSPDRSGEICDEYARKDRRVRVFHKENGGVSSARNMGLDHARGEYICFVDSDDWVELSYLDTIMRKSGNADIMFFAFSWHYEDGCVKTMTYGNKYTEGVDEIEKCIFFLRENCTELNFFGYTWNKVFRSDVIRSNHIKFVEDLDTSEDEVFTLDFCLKVNNIKVIPDVLYHYRWRYNGLTHKYVPTEKWLLLAEQVSALIKSMQTVGLKQIYRNWVFRIYLSACLSTKSLVGYLSHIFNAHRYAVSYEIKGYKQLMVRNVLAKIRNCYVQ